jgi:hypothetical protein
VKKLGGRTGYANLVGGEDVGRELFPAAAAARFDGDAASARDGIVGVCAAGVVAGVPQTCLNKSQGLTMLGVQRS